MEGRRVRHRFEQVPVLEGEGVRLRGLRPTDIPDVREISFYDGVAAESDADALAMLERITDNMLAGEGVHWGICLPGSDEVVGTCGFHRGYPDNVAEVGYVLREEYRGRGIMTAAVRVVVAFGFDEMGLAGVRAFTDPHNDASVAVLRRAGFRETAGSGGMRRFELPRPTKVGDDVA